ncbi:helix-turn-helix domain-containing protein [Streptomyces sp. NPDC021212]|uniref:helix-turn-helix domain-containing protein n=1 Tax=Streptomyces sp. NPDC021212 TaxID=3365118 RepID=UPI0037A3A773
MSQQMWNVSDLADYLGKPASWVYDNHAREAIPSFRVGQQLRFSPTEIEDWLENKCRERAAA